MPKHIPTKQSVTENPFSHIRNLVFQGGGVKGLGYLGAIRELTNSKKDRYIKLAQIERVCGASAGAITAFFLALGYDANKLNKELRDFELIKLLDDVALPCGESATTIICKLSSLFCHKEPCDTAKNLSIYFLYQIGTEMGVNLAKYSAGGLFSDLKKSYPGFYGCANGFISLLGSLVPEFVYSYPISMTMGLGDAVIQKIIEDKAGVVLSEVEKNITDFYAKQDEAEPGEYLKSLLKGVRDVLQLILKNTAVFPGDAFVEELKGRLKGNQITEGKYIPEDITFFELAQLKKDYPDKGYKDLYVVALNLSLGRTDIFSVEHTPNVVVIDAVRASMSVPVIFKPPRIAEKVGGHLYSLDYLYTDGGVFDNYPIWMFDRRKFIPAYSEDTHVNSPEYNNTTLGVRLVSSERWRLYEIDMQSNPQYQTKYSASPLEFLGALLQAYFNKQESDYLHSGSHERTIHIDDLGISTLQFDMNDREKRRLVRSGRRGVEQYRIRDRAHHPSKDAFSDDHSSSIQSQAINLQRRPYQAHLQRLNERNLKVEKTIADGNCAFHALFGIPNERGEYELTNVLSRRQQIAEKVRKIGQCNRRHPYRELLEEAIQEIIVNYHVPLPQESVLNAVRQRHVAFGRESDQIREKNWQLLESAINEYPEILAYIDFHTPEQEKEKPLNTRFQWCLLKGEGLLSMMRKKPSLYQHYRVYKKQTEENFNWEQWLSNDELCRNLIDEYATRIIGEAYRFLSFKDVAVVACVENITVKSIVYNRGLKRDFPQEPLNPGQESTVMLRHDGGIHFERVNPTLRQRKIQSSTVASVTTSKENYHGRIQLSSTQMDVQKSMPTSTTRVKGREKKVSRSTQTLTNRSELRRKLIFECKRGNYTGVTRIIRTGLWPGEPDSEGEWSLSAAIWGGNPKVVQYLCNKLGSEVLTWEHYARFNTQKYSATSRLESDWQTAVDVFKNFEGLYFSQNIFLQYVFEAVLRMTADTVLVPITLGGRKKAPISISTYKEQLKQDMVDNEGAIQIVKVNGVYNPRPNNPPSNASISIMLRINANECKLNMRGNRVMFDVRGANGLWERQQVGWLDGAVLPTHRRVINIMNDVFKHLILNAEANQKKSSLFPLSPSELSSCTAGTVTYTQKDWVEMEVYYKGLQGARLSQHGFLRCFIDTLLEKTGSDSLLKQLKEDTENNRGTTQVRKAEVEKDKQDITIVFSINDSIMDRWKVRIMSTGLQLSTPRKKEDGIIRWHARKHLVWLDKENFSVLQRINDITRLAQERAVTVGKTYEKLASAPYTASQAFFSDVGSGGRPQERAKQAFTFLQNKMTHFWVFDNAVFDECSRAQQSSCQIAVGKDKNGYSYASFRPSSCLEISDNHFLDLSITTQFSIEVWAKPVKLASDKENMSYLIARNVQDISGGIFKVVSLGWTKDYYFVIGSTVTKPHRHYKSSHTFPPNQYYHLVLTYAEGRVKLYVDGLREIDEELIISHRPGNWNIGSEVERIRSVSPKNWDGEIRCIRTYCEALTPEYIEILSKELYLTYASFQPGDETCASEAAEAGSTYGHH